MKRQFINFLILLLFFSCSMQEKKEVKFEIPVIYQPNVKYKKILHNVDSLQAVWPIFFGKYKYTDTIKLIKKNKRPKDTLFKKDIIEEFVLWKNESFPTDGFQIFTDYKTTIFIENCRRPNEGNSFFPVYVVNETTNTKVFYAKDCNVFALQEAIDSTKYNSWRPIECRGRDWCGNGNFGLKIHPKEFVMFLLPKYKGDEKTSMRVRLRINENIYISKPFLGTFNKGQFKLKKQSFEYLRFIEDPIISCNSWFYGAIPSEFDY